MARFINQRPSAATDPLRNFRFVVKFMPYGDGLGGVGFDATVGFTSVSGLAMSTDAIPYREGGYATTMHMLPGQQQFSPVVFQRGVVLGNTQSWNWWKKIFDPGYTKTDDTPNALTAGFRCEIAISVLAHPQPLVQDYDPNLDDPVAARVRLINAWPTNLAYTDLNAGDSAIWVESMQVVHEGMDVEFASAATESTFNEQAWGTLLASDPGSNTKA